MKFLRVEVTTLAVLIRTPSYHKIRGFLFRFEMDWLDFPCFVTSLYVLLEHRPCVVDSELDLKPNLVSFFTVYVQNGYIIEFFTQSRSFWCLNHAKRPDISEDMNYFRVKSII
jgi:hypothetical protein